LDDLPFPARDLVDLLQFKAHSYIDFGKRSATMITSRGCPFKCFFCSAHLTMGSKYRLRSVEKVLSEIEELKVKYGVDHIIFEDDTITLKRERIERICNGLLKMPVRPSWYCLSRVDSMDEELAHLMKRAGCRMIAFGIESGSPHILKKINKKISLSKAKSAIEACNKAGIRSLCTFIVGFPFDTKETMKMTFKTAKELNPTMAIFFPLTPYPGTTVYNDFFKEKDKLDTPDKWANFIQTCNNSGISVNRNFSGQELKKISDSFNRKFYFRPKQIVNIIKTIKSPSDFLNIYKGVLYFIQRMLFPD